MNIADTMVCPRHRVRERFYWPGMKKDVHEWVISCEECCQKKSPHQKHIHSLTTWKPSRPFWRVALDIMGPLPEPRGNKYILLIGDQFTKWYEAIPMSNQEASTVAKEFVNVWVSRFGCPANRSTASTLQNVAEQRYQTRSASGITRPRKLKDYFLFKDNDADEKFDNDVFLLKGDTTKCRGRGTHIGLCS